MSPHQKHQKEKRRKNLFRKWHRRLGFTAALFLFNLAITGILLNHSDDLDLHNKYISTQWLIDWYGVKAPKEITCVATPSLSKKICQIGEKIYFDDSLIIEESSSLIGLVEHQELIYLSTSNAIYVYTKEFELVEKLGHRSGLPAPIIEVISLNNIEHHFELNIAVIANAEIFLFNQNDVTWEKSKFRNFRELIHSSSGKTDLLNLSEKKSNHLRMRYLEHQITYLKVVQDLHSGRILLNSGKILTDILGLVIIMLGISGFIAWQRRKNKAS